ncbi:MAG: hypothetical protein WBX17_02950, partial [Microbacterium sp.]
MGDLRVGTITSTEDDVNLWALDPWASILDAGAIDDGSARVAGAIVQLVAGATTGRVGGPEVLEPAVR